MRASVVLGCALAASGACGTDAPPVRAGAGAPPLAQPGDGSGDLAVATVDGRPVWGSCVAAQERRGADRRRALDECIAFELLAREAEARGLAADPEVGEALRAALVSRLVETDFEARYQRPADLGAPMEREIDRYADQLDRPEMRASAFARVEVPKDAPPQTEAAAQALAERIAASLAGESGLFPAHLREAAERESAGAGAGLRVAIDQVPAKTREGLVPPFADALFAIPEVGRVSPPTRTPWGWDIVLLVRLLPPEHRAREEVAAKVFPSVRRRQFYRWMDAIRKVDIDWRAVDRALGAAGSAAGSASAAAPPAPGGAP